MKNSQKGFIMPLLLALIAILLIGGGVYFYENKKVEAPAVVNTGAQQPDQVQQQTVSSASESQNTPTATAPSIKFFTSDSLSVQFAKSATLSWNVTPVTGTSCVLHVNGITLAGMTLSNNWNTSELYQDAKYTLDCKNENGSSSKSLTIVVAPKSKTTSAAVVPQTNADLSLPSINSFFSQSTSVVYGGSTWLSWNISPATGMTCRLLGNDNAVLLQSLPQNWFDIHDWRPVGGMNSDTTYTLTCTNSVGTSSKSITVKVVP